MCVIYIKRNLDELENQKDINLEAFISQFFTKPSRAFPHKYLNHRKALQLQPLLCGEETLWLEFYLLSIAKKQKVTQCDEDSEETRATLRGPAVTK